MIIKKKKQEFYYIPTEKNKALSTHVIDSKQTHQIIFDFIKIIGKEKILWKEN